MNGSNDLFFAWEDIDWIQVDTHVRRKQVYLEKLMHVLVEIKAGGHGAVHQHPHEQTGILLKGTLKVTVADKAKIIKIGEGYLVPPDTPHGVEVIGGEDVWILDTFTPIREDLIRD